MTLYQSYPFDDTKRSFYQQGVNTRKICLMLMLALMPVLLIACSSPALGTTTFSCQVNDSNQLTSCTDSTKNGLIYQPLQEIDNSNGSLAVALQQTGQGQDLIFPIAPATASYQYDYLVVLLDVSDTQDAHVVDVTNKDSNHMTTQICYIVGNDTCHFTAIGTTLFGAPVKKINFSITISGNNIIIKQEGPD
jgi:hypothetical protein